MRSIDSYTLLMVALTAALLVVYALARETVILDLVKVAFGVTLGTLAKKAETTIVITDPAAAQKIAEKYL